ncbi:hypothetical protein [Luteimonas kalidii]|uniref:Uncharacterized protein n=1 Tax=Luteimonas kalidii TaxID=3042025 RepID=A0ABT6JSF6_9GAMM|nr:hypothetical protein [Luteimonas kalidii]MDH5833398.1 hypothetical protein [Luteimonas kalidii]
MDLSATVGKSIDAFCGNKFTAADQNHCAHFVSHALEIEAGYTCRTHTGRSTRGAALRVHELFATCPRVGEWTSSEGDSHLVFVTDRANVDLDKHSMRNVPKKHVGIFWGGQIYHYSNTRDLVVQETPQRFLARFQASYGGNQALFFGGLPFAVDGVSGATAEQRPNTGHGHLIRSDRATSGSLDYYATLPGAAEFYLGREVAYGKYRGLMQPQSRLSGPRFDATQFVDEYQSVAGMLDVISSSESGGRFNRINSYDRAAFTFGFFQFAAHTPRDNLVLLLRGLAADNPAFQALFPELTVVDGVLHRRLGQHLASLEKEHPRPEKPTESNLGDLMRYLNPEGSRVDETELSTAARLVHLSNTDEASRRWQVRLAANITMQKIRRLYANWYDIDGASDLVCTAIADIHHQGRGTKSEVRAALSLSGEANRLAALCRIGEQKYSERCVSLRKSLNDAETQGTLGASIFDRASGLFKPASGWIE